MTDKDASSEKKKQPEKAQRFRLHFGDDTLDGGFAQIPNNLLRYYHRLGITAEEAMFLVHLIGTWYDFQDNDPNLGRIAQRMGKHLRTIQRYSRSLEVDRKLIKVHERYDEFSGAQIENEYNLAPLIQAVNAIYREEKKAAEAAAEKKRLDRTQPQSPQMHLPLDTGENQEPESTTAAFLQSLNVTEPTLSQIVGHDLATVQAWWWYIQTQQGLADKQTGYLINRLRQSDPPPDGYAELAQVWLELADEGRWKLLQAEKNHRLYRRRWQLPDGCSLTRAALAALAALVEANVDFGISAPTPEQLDCANCNQPHWPDELCPGCGHCPDCCTCEPVVEEELTEAEAIWHETVTYLEWQTDQYTINHLIRPVRVIGLENGELHLAAENDRAKQQLEGLVNRAGLIDRALTDAAGRELKARFVLIES